jgi:glutamate formiminotransferase / formiminotetrahydrofolate cyclodeaminase
MNQLIECIPNFSEGRRPEIIEQILDKIRAVEAVALLDHSSDSDHNRSVVTFAGPPEDVLEAAYQAIAAAAQLIDLNQHSGEHPRIGATDVVPLVPLKGINTAECAELAKQLAERVAAELNLPVYLYEAAAATPERKNLAWLRRGQYEGLKEEIKSDPLRKPDYGPAELGSAGAVVIGARAPLVAFNVYLNSGDVEIARQVARSIRHLSGGFRFVKAMGMLVDGRAQVSMNLTNYTKTPLHRVVDAIRREAARYGVAVQSSELIGLIPQEALIDTACWHLQLDEFNNNQILEQKLAQTQKIDLTEDFIDRVASGAPTPGGGAAAAHTGALGAALIAMTARLTIGRKQYADVHDDMLEVLSEAEALRAELLAAVERDMAAFDEVMRAYRLPQDSDKEKTLREAAVEEVTFQAAEEPLTAARTAVRVLNLAVPAAQMGNINAISDAASGAAHARAALDTSSLNVRINLLNVSNRKRAQAMLDTLETLETSARLIEEKLATVLRERGGL